MKATREIAGDGAVAMDVMDGANLADGVDLEKNRAVRGRAVRGREVRVQEGIVRTVPVVMTSVEIDRVPAGRVATGVMIAGTTGGRVRKSRRLRCALSSCPRRRCWAG